MVKNIDNQNNNIEDLDSIKSELNDLKKNIESNNEDLSSFSNELNLLKKEIDKQNNKEDSKEKKEWLDLSEISAELDELKKEVKDKIDQTKINPDNLESKESESQYNKPQYRNTIATKKIENLQWRPEWVVDEIVKSSDSVEDMINNWEQEPNPIAKSLLRIVNRIMKSERK